MLDFLDEAFRSGFFTHCFLETGSFDEASPRLRLVRAKDERQNIFDLASLTKALVTGPLACRLLYGLNPEESRNIRIADLRGSEQVPEYLRHLKLETLLSHRSGLPAWTNFWIEQLDAQKAPEVLRKEAPSHIIRVLSRRHLDLGPELDCYSDVGFILVGYVLEKYFGIRLDELFVEHLNSLKLEHGENLGFAATEIQSKQHYITTAYCQIRQRWLRGEVHDENCAALGGVAGHAGLFATGAKLSQLLKASMNHDETSKFWELNERRRLLKQGLLGLRPGDDRASMAFAQGEAMGHWGFTGTGFWVHQPSRRYAILLSNRVISGRISTQIKEFRYQALSYLDRQWD